MPTSNPNSSSNSNSRPFEGAQITEAKDRDYAIFPERDGNSIAGSGRTTVFQERFLSWWKTTNFGSGRNRLPSSIPNRRGLTIGLDKIWITTTRGHIWPLFRQLAALGNGEPKVQCTICLAILQHPKATHQGSGSLTRHVQGQHPTLTASGLRTNSAHRVLADQSVHENTSSPSSRPQENHENVERDRKRAFLCFGLEKKLPFNWAEDPATAIFMSRLGLQIRLPGRKELKSELEKQFRHEKTQLDLALKTRFKISIAVDYWKLSNHLCFLAIVVYWIDKDWVFHEALLDAPLINQNNSAEEIGRILSNVLYERKLESRLLGVTSRDGAKLVSIRQTLERQLGEKNIHWKATDFALSCIAHVIQLAANAFCQSLDILATKRDKGNSMSPYIPTDTIRDIDPAITVSKIRTIIKLVKSSSARSNRFKALQGDQRIRIPLITGRGYTEKWIGMYWMITFAFLNKHTIIKWLEQEFQHTSDSNIILKLPRLTIATEEWYPIRLITSVLKPLVTLTNVLSGTREPLIHRSLVFLSAIIDGLRGKLSMHLRNRYVSGKLKCDFISAIEAAIQEIETFYPGPKGSSKLPYNLAMALDPTRKLLLFKEWDIRESSKIEKYYDKYRKEFIDYFTERYQHTTSGPPEISLFRPSFQVRRSLEIEATRYLDSEVIDDEGGELKPLDWWRKNEKDFPELAKMARDVLSVAISGIGVKRIFNQGRDIQKYVESGFNGQTIRKAIFLVNSFDQTTALLEHKHRRPHLPDDPDDLFDYEDIKDNLIIDFDHEDDNNDDDDDDDDDEEEGREKDDDDGDDDYDDDEELDEQITNIHNLHESEITPMDFKVESAADSPFSPRIVGKHETSLQLTKNAI